MALWLLVFATLPVAFGDQCPFSKDCQCTQIDPTQKRTFSSVDCRSSTGLPVLSSRGYEVKGRLSIRGDVSNIPASYFLPFWRIDELYLEQTVGSSPVFQSWSSQTFDGPNIISNLTVVGLSGLFPSQPSNWLSTADSKWLRRLTISKSANLSFTDTDLHEAHEMERLEVMDSDIESLSPLAFHLVILLHDVKLKNAGLTSFVLEDEENAIQHLNLEQNGNLSRVSLDKMTVLESVLLNGNDLTEAVKDQSFSLISDHVIDISMENCGLDAVPTQIFKGHGRPTGILSLAKNSITILKSDDFQGADFLTRLILSNNPISSAEGGTFKPLNKLATLDMSNAIRYPNLDLIDFAFVGSLMEIPTTVSIKLDNNDALKGINASSTEVSFS